MKLADVKKFFKDPQVVELTEAGINNNLTKVREILTQKKINLNEPGYLWATPMHFIMVWSTSEIIIEFIRHGADPLSNAYSKGTPFKTMLTSVNNSLETKMDKVKAIVSAGVNISSSAFVEELRHLSYGALEYDVQSELTKTLVRLGIKLNTVDYEGNLVFGGLNSSIDKAEFLLDHGSPLFESGGVNRPLAFAIYEKRKLQPTNEAIDRVFKKLLAKGVTEADLEKRYGSAPSWKSFRESIAIERPNEVLLELYLARGHGVDLPGELLLPMILKVKLVGENAKAERQLEKYFGQALSQLMLSRSTWNEKIQDYKLDSKYLKTLKPIKNGNEMTLLFDAVLAFPQWRELFLSKSSHRDTILKLSTGFEQSLSGGKSIQRMEHQMLSTNGTLSPVFER